MDLLCSKHHTPCWQLDARRQERFPIGVRHDRLTRIKVTVYFGVCPVHNLVQSKYSWQIEASYQKFTWTVRSKRSSEEQTYMLLCQRDSVACALLPLVLWVMSNAMFLARQRGYALKRVSRCEHARLIAFSASHNCNESMPQPSAIHVIGKMS